jgi:hypothetical protein
MTSRKGGRLKLGLSRSARRVVPIEVVVCEAGVEVFCGIDPGYRHMCAVLWAYLDHEDTMVVFDELAVAKTVISEVCKEIKLRNERRGARPNWYVIDPAARNKNGQRFTSWRC